MDIRPAHTNDAAEIVRLARLMFDSIGIDLSDDAWEAEGRRHVRQRLGVDLAAFVIDHPDEPGRLVASALGIVTQRLPNPAIRDGRFGYVQWVCTDPDYRRQGLARASHYRTASGGLRSWRRTIGCVSSHRPWRTLVHKPADCRGAPGVPGADPDDERAQYQVIAHRRALWDTLVWQVPALTLTAEAFLFTIALSSSSRQMARIMASSLAALISFLSMSLMSRHRRSEVYDAQLLADYEDAHHLPVVHGPAFRDGRAKLRQGGWLAAVRAFWAWWIGLFLFGAAAIAILVVSIASPNTLS